MGRRAKFHKRQFIEAALQLVSKNGPAALTVTALAERVGAPVGSVYHRFRSRDVLMAELWLDLVEGFQAGFLEALNQDDGRSAARHTPRWVRSHHHEARVMLRYRREDLMTGEWPEDMQSRAKELADQLEAGIRDFTARRFGRVTEADLNRVVMALIDVPHATVRRLLQSGQDVREDLDKLIEEAYEALMGRGK
jgi:AcrR family transcriptional regulator